MTPSQATVPAWSAFQEINANRRAIRDFDGTPIDDADIRAVLNEALLAPSSANTQPFTIHWLRDPAIKAKAAEACRSQRAAVSATTLLVFVAGARHGIETTTRFRAHLESTSAIGEKSRSYHLRQIENGRKFLRLAPLPVCSPLHWLLTAIFPSFTLAPVGPRAVRNWAARSALFAAQTVLLAASARGLDSCPMEGFDARKLAKLLGLRRGEVIPLVIAIGRRREDARIEPRWRRSLEDAVCIH